MPYEQSAPAGGYESYACMQEDTYHKVTHSLNSYCGKRKRARRPCCKSVTRRAGPRPALGAVYS